jgi:surface protein
MFSGCRSLTSLNLSNFDTSKVTNTYDMFKDCNNLKTIIVSNKFVTNNMTTSIHMFHQSSKIVGGNGTKYNSNYVDRTYARIDKSGTPGYFTSANTRIVIDSPKNNPQITSSNVVISGWAMSHIYDKRVDIYVDNTKISGITYVKRDDVISAITDAGTILENPTPGFTVTHSIAGLSNGTHTVKVNVVDTQNNTILQTATSTFTTPKRTITTI